MEHVDAKKIIIQIQTSGIRVKSFENRTIIAVEQSIALGFPITKDESDILTAIYNDIPHRKDHVPEYDV